MLLESVATLERHLHYWHFYNKTGELVNFYPHVKTELLQVMRTEIDPYYHLNDSCPACVVEFINRLFKWYDKQKLSGTLPRK